MRSVGAGVHKDVVELVRATDAEKARGGKDQRADLESAAAVAVGE